jgi:hypothetical protein
MVGLEYVLVILTWKRTCYVKIARSINICIHMKIVVQPQVIDSLAHFVYVKIGDMSCVNRNLIGLPQHFVMTWTAEFIKQVPMGLILSRDHIHTYCWGFSWSQSLPWVLYAFVTSTKYHDMTGRCLIYYIMRNSSSFEEGGCRLLWNIADCILWFVCLQFGAVCVNM